MPMQSKRISLMALGIEGVRGMEDGFHLRIGFDPRMGFPPCGFNLYRRDHHIGKTQSLNFPLLFSQQISAPFRHGYLQNGVAIFNPKPPKPQLSKLTDIAISMFWVAGLPISTHFQTHARTFTWRISTL